MLTTDDLLAWFQRLAGVERRAEVQAPTTAHTGIEVEQLLPREVVEFGYAEVLLLFDVGDQGQRRARLGRAQKDVGWAGEDVRQL